MKRIRFLLPALSFLLIFFSVARGQFNANLFIQPNPSPYPGDWETNPSIGFLTLVNGGAAPRQVSFNLRISPSSGGAPLVSGSSRLLTILPGPQPTILNNTEFLDLRNVRYNASIRTQVVRSGRFPEGTYVACLDVLDANGAVILANVCSAPFTIIYPNAPYLVSPADRDTARQQYPVFTWTPATAPVGFSVHYELTLVEVLPGQVPAQALAANVPPQYANTSLITPSLIYPVDALPLKEEKTYAWWIQALDQNGYPVSTNNGRSQIFTFVFKSQIGPPPPAPRKECFVMAAASPPDNGTTAEAKIKFAVEATPALNGGNLAIRTIRIWKLKDSSGTGSSVQDEAPRFTSSLAVSPATLALSDVDTTGTRLDVLMGAGDSVFTPESGQWYIWQFVLKGMSGMAMRKDGKSCDVDTAASPFFKFVFRPSEIAEDTGACRDVCSATAPADQTPAAFSISQGDTLRVGKFTLVLTEAGGGAGSLSGKGEILVPLLNARVAVEFSGLKVNGSREVYDGEVTGRQAAASPLSAAVANGLGGALNLDSAQISSVSSLAAQGENLVSALAGKRAVFLPIGLDNVVAGQRYVVGIIGMVFTPTGAFLNAAASIPLPDLGPGIGLGFGARSICFSPSGFGGNGNVTLYLASDIGYQQDSSWGFRFLAPSQSDSGCYVAMDCHGFKRCRVSAQVEFPRSWLVPSPDDGSGKVKASFKALVSRGSGWMAAASLDRCELAGAPGFVLEVQEMTFDKSSLENPPDIFFPADYTGIRDETWTGFFIKRATVALPPQLSSFTNTQPLLAVQNLIIGRGGVTGSFRAENIFAYPQANFGGWGGSLDTLAIEVVCSSLRQGWIKGKISLPIATDTLLYSATLSRPSKTDQKGLTYAFVISPGDSFHVDLWKARLLLDRTSNIEITNDNPTRTLTASALLNGSLSVVGDIGGISGVNMPGLGFQNLKLSSAKPYFTNGTWSFASPQKGVAGFPVSISGIGMESRTEGGKDLSGLKFTLSVQLSPGSNAISGGTTLTLWGELNSGGPQRFRFHSIALDSIGVNADLGAVKVIGSVNLYRSDRVFGTGFRGAIQATFLENVQVSSTVQFGKAPAGFRYWYVDAKGVFSAGIPFGTGVGFYGLGGGVWYNMRKTNAADPPMPASSGMAGPAPGATASGYQFVPDEGKLGFRAMVVLGTYPSATSFNADIALEVALTQTSTGVSIGTISLKGAGYMMAAITARRNAKVTCDANISYDFPNKVLHGVFNMRVNAPPVSGYGQMTLHVAPPVWYIRVGDPSNRITLSLASWLRTGAYLMCGTSVPAPPPPPPQVVSVLGLMPSARNAKIDTGNGFAFGASMSVATGRQYFLIFYGDISFLGGFDMALLQQARCAGINGWYAQGQLYAYINASVGLHVELGFWTYYPCCCWWCAYLCRWCRGPFVGYRGDFEILGISAAALLQAGGPNPLWVSGRVAGRYSILGGLVTGYCTFQFTKGSVCTL